MNRDDDTESQNGQIMESTPAMAMLNKSEIDQQVATAHAYPRSIKQFITDATTLVTMSESVAESCGYALARRQYDKEAGGYITKTIEGPSARFAEIAFSCWGNARAGSSIVSEGEEFVTARGFMFDLQRNVAIQMDVPRRITDSKGKRYKTDMIGVTANAAASIALRNAILKVIPKALWEPIYLKARATAVGDEATLSNKRMAALAEFQKRGASAETIFEHFGIKGIEDITLDHLATLLGYKTALKEGDTTIEQLFGKDDPAATGKATTSVDELAARAATRPMPAATPAPSAAPAATSAPAADGQPDLLASQDGGPAVPTFEALSEKLKKARTLESLQVHADWIRYFQDPAQKLVLEELYQARQAAMTK